jgi:hypothetical protein
LSFSDDLASIVDPDRSRHVQIRGGGDQSIQVNNGPVFPEPTVAADEANTRISHDLST